MSTKRKLMVLTEDVSDPKPDRRRGDTLFRPRTIPKGTVFLVEAEVVEVEAKQVIFLKHLQVTLFTVGMLRWIGKTTVGTDWKQGPIDASCYADLVMAKLVEHTPKTTEELIVLATGDSNREGTMEMAMRILGRLIVAGVVSTECVRSIAEELSCEGE